MENKLIVSLLLYVHAEPAYRKMYIASLIALIKAFLSVSAGLGALIYTAAALRKHFV